MKIQLTTLALVTLATLAAACDPQIAEPSVSETKFRGDELDPPTTTTTGIFKLKGGHDDPEEWGHTFEEVSLATQIAYYKVADKVAADMLMDAFTSDERNIETAIHACEDRHMGWSGEFTLEFIHAEHGKVSGVRDEGGSWGWESEARVVAEIGFGCVP